jgi:hypothetical protein
MEGFGWKFLPGPGGLLDQDEVLMDDLLTISMVNGWMQPQDEAALRAKFR